MCVLLFANKMKILQLFYIKGKDHKGEHLWCSTSRHLWYIHPLGGYMWSNRRLLYALEPTVSLSRVHNPANPV